MALTIAFDKPGGYINGETVTATVTATASELTVTLADLKEPASAVVSGAQFTTSPALVITDAKTTWSVASRNATTLVIKATAKGNSSVTVTLGAASVTGAYTAADAPPPAGGDVRQANGILPWGNPMKGGMMKAYAPDLLAQSWVGGMSAFCRWDDITDNGTTFKWDGIDAIADACRTAKKPFLLMMIVGNADNGLPTYVQNAIPAKEIIDVRSENFPVFWSVTGTSLLNATLEKLIDRYKSHPYWAGLRYTDFWANHGEPWFAGGAYGKTAWPEAWNRTHSPPGTLATVQAAYQQREKDRFAWLGARVPAHIAIGQAGGDGLYDVDGSKDTGDPLRHPDRLATWSAIRASIGPERAVLQYNGVNAGKGASGYGEWLPKSFGPKASLNPVAARRGRIGSQPVAEVGTDRLSFDGAVTMIRNLTDWGYSYCELYIQDAVKALKNDTADNRKLRAVIEERKNSWYHA